ncbi:GroES-like protein [Lojkania enalia]|uniref:GroES-like protein n=1 Tax=Lojkania enalia TaxID=147567 RepID=A0A9P4N027_9PLEO|nr:GroES-like protein [Didymosphaeria enalia]
MPSFTVYKGSHDGSIKKAQTTKPDLRGDDVLIRVTASGLCGTDEHYRNVDMVLGHEGTGVVEATGPDVKYLKKGQRVGWGYEHDSCGHCDQCLSGMETFCPQRAIYGEADLDQGSFASHAVWREAFLFQIPGELTDKEAAPLMCGGATVFNALRMYNIPSTARVGIMGVGGLGHLAIQFASKMGCDVVVLSGTDSKKEEAMKLGAHEFIATKGKSELDLGRKLDALLITASIQPDWKLLLPAMAPNSVIFPLTVSGNDLVVPYMPLILNGTRIQGSIVAPRHLHREMLQFAAQHSIKPMIQEFPMSEDGIAKAMNTLNEGKMRYRGVLVPQ